MVVSTLVWQSLGQWFKSHSEHIVLWRVDHFHVNVAIKQWMNLCWIMCLRARKVWSWRKPLKSMKTPLRMFRLLSMARKSGRQNSVPKFKWVFSWLDFLALSPWSHFYLWFLLKLFFSVWKCRSQPIFLHLLQKVLCYGNYFAPVNLLLLQEISSSNNSFNPGTLLL